MGCSLKYLQLHTDEELYWGPIEWTLEEYSKFKLAKILGINPSTAARLKSTPWHINQQAESEGEGEPLLNERCIRRIRDYQMGGTV